MKKLTVFFGAAYILSATAGSVFTTPVPANASQNLLKNSGFVQVVKCSDKIMNYYNGKKVIVKNAELPSGFELMTKGQPQHAGGAIALEFLPDNRNRYISIHTPHNKYDSGTALLSESMFTLDKGGKEPLYCGLWIRGNGTVIVKILLRKGEKFQDVHVEKMLATASWHYFRARIPEKLRGKGDLKLSLSVYGSADIAFPEIAPLPAVDRTAELLLYVPFERGALDAKFSRGPVSSHGTPELPAVSGVAGDAARFDRKRRFNENGKIRYPMGFGYDFLGKALDRDRGTVEFFFRPLDEMLEKQQWGAAFPLLFLGDTSWQWPNSEDFFLELEVLPRNKLRISYRENVRKKTWPGEIPLPNTQSETRMSVIPDDAYVGRFQSYAVTPCGSYIIPDAKAFIGEFHHLAFTYDEKERTVWLDGKPIIKAKALKTPAVSSRIPKLLFANSHIGHPATMSSDLDELKIYSGVKYHKNFIPAADPPAFQKIQFVAGKNVPWKWQSFSPYLAEDSRKLCFPLLRGDEKYTLEVACADGLPLLFSPRNASFNLRTDYQVEMPHLEFELKNIAGSAAEVFLKKRGTTIRCELINKGENCVLKLNIIKSPSKFKAYLEPQITLRKAVADWQKAFDGAAVRDILLPFLRFEFEDVFMAMPLAAAWNGSSGSALAMTPESLCSWMSRGMSAANALTLKLRTVLDNRDRIDFAFDLISINSKYGENDAVDRYHALHPEFFKLDENLDPRVYGNTALSEVWSNTAYLERKDKFSLAEFNRKTRGRWCWYYYDSSSTGNFSTDPELLKELAPVNIRHLGDNNFHDDFLARKTVEWVKLSNMGVIPGLYVSSWLDRRFQRYFSYSDYESQETYNGVGFWPQYWCRNIIDHIMLPTGTDFGVFLREHMKRMLRNVGVCNTFAFDLCGYDYKYRQQNTLGGLNAFDENGAFLQHSTALALLLDDMKRMKNHSEYKTAVIGNVDLHLSGYSSSFRQANTIHEQQTPLTLQAEQLRRRQTRLQGERPTTFHAMPPLTGNFYGDEDPRMLRYAAVFDHHNHVLLGMLYNIRQNTEIFGVKESVEVLDELLRTQSLGYRQTVGACISGKLQLVRYGEIERGAIAAVNSSPWKQSGDMELDTAYFKAMPLAAVEGQTVSFDNGKLKIDNVAPLSWKILEFAGAIPEIKELAYTSSLCRKPDIVTATFNFTRPAYLGKLLIKPCSNERAELYFNGSKIRHIPEQVRAGDTLRIVFRNIFWLSPSEQVIAADYEKEGVVALSAEGKTAETAAGRVAEFFRYHAAVTDRKYRVNEKSGDPVIKIIESSDLPAGISIKNGQVMIAGKSGQLHALTEEFLKALDRRYVWYGVFGTQQPTRPLDWGATGMQRKFLKRHGLTGKKVSVQEIVRDFVNFLNEKKINVTEGF